MNPIYKAMAIVTHEGTVLATKGYDHVKKEAFFRIPGGHIEQGENPETAVRREYREEFDTDLLNLKFLKTIENEFIFNGRKWFEKTSLFRADLANAELYNQKLIRFFDGKDMEAVWLPIEEVKSGKSILYPDWRPFL